ncbi:MAG: HD domain-containing protein [Nitrospiraceae bacterium]|nr:HD domain-containing protein [Nitrospiraceae bacterium]
MTGSERLSILIVDDESQLRELFLDMLRDLGHDAVAAAGPRQAIETLAKQRFDIAFVDQYLGPMLGLDLMQEMAKRDGALSFIMITANGTTDLAVEALQRGAADFLVKPFFEEDVVRSIDYVRKKKALEGQRRQLMRDLEARVAEKTAELIEVNFAVLATLVRTMEKKDQGTYGHSMRVCEFAERIADRMALPQDMHEDLRAAAMLHDIGKISISDTILGKPAPLTDEEFGVVRKHPENGVEILRPLPHYRKILPVILAHHERYDGTGYPQGLSGGNIPLLARIISVADTCDAILSDRPYRPAANHGQVVRELKGMAGRQFDPAVVHAFLDVFGEEDAKRPFRAGGVHHAHGQPFPPPDARGDDVPHTTTAP